MRILLCKNQNRTQVSLAKDARRKGGASELLSPLEGGHQNSDLAVKGDRSDQYMDVVKR